MSVLPVTMGVSHRKLGLGLATEVQRAASVLNFGLQLARDECKLWD